MLQAAFCSRSVALCGGRCACGLGLLGMHAESSLLAARPILAMTRSSRPNNRLHAVNLQFRPQVVSFTQCASLRTSARHGDEDKRRAGWHLSMSDDEKKRKQEHIEKLKAEEAPKGLIAKVKYYLKRYWYIAIPAHCLSSILWFGGAYAAVASGVDVVSLLEWLHIPDAFIEKIKNTPPSAGYFVVALIVYKIATPARYATTLAFIQAIFWGLRRVGKLPTAHEVEYKVRSEYEQGIRRLGRRYYKTNAPPVKRSSHAAAQRRNSIPGKRD